MPPTPDSNPYTIENVPLFEALYGKHLISLGGTAAIDNMFSDLSIKKGLKALDVGFGLGGVAYYLAQKYQINISGVELHPWMVQYAQANAPHNLSQRLKFDVYDEKRRIPFAAESFDVVYSKGVLNHVKDKETLFSQINSLLKQNGLFVIADWIYPEAKANNPDPMVYETQESYQQVLHNTGFKDIEFRNDSEIFLSYVKSLLENIKKQQNNIKQAFSKEIFSTLWNQHQDMMEDIKHQRKIATRILAKK